MDRTGMPPWELGGTFFGIGGTPNTDFSNIVGREYEFERPEKNGSTALTHVGKMMRVRVVRNAAGISLLPRQLVRFKASAVNETEVDGYTLNPSAVPDRGYPVDEFLPSAGVASNDLFYIVIRGPAEVLLPLAGADFPTDIAIGDALVSSSGTTSGATTSGRIGKMLMNATSGVSNLAANLIAMVGRALSAATTQQTTAGQKILVSVGRW